MMMMMWNVNAKVIPVKIGATGTISESFGQNVSNAPGKQEIKEPKKGEKKPPAILGTAHVLLEVMM
jgi:hypothetical protein